MSSATGQTEPISSRRSRRAAQPMGRAFDVSNARMASISDGDMCVFHSASAVPIEAPVKL